MQHTIDHLLFPYALGLDITGPLEVFNSASKILKRQGKSGGGYLARFVAGNKGPVGLRSGLDRARELLTAGNSTLEQIAVNSGFGREERRRRAFLRRFKATPSQYRLHFLKA